MTPRAGAAHTPARTHARTRKRRSTRGTDTRCVETRATTRHHSSLLWAEAHGACHSLTTCHAEGEGRAELALSAVQSILVAGRPSPAFSRVVGRHGPWRVRLRVVMRPLTRTLLSKEGRGADGGGGKAGEDDPEHPGLLRFGLPSSGRPAGLQHVLNERVGLMEGFQRRGDTMHAPAVPRGDALPRVTGCGEGVEVGVG